MNNEMGMLIFQGTRHVMSPQRLVALAAGLLVVVLSTGCGPSGDDHAVNAAMTTDAQGQITVPDGSQLRTRLTVQAVSVDTGSTTLDLPAAVEADPIRVVNILTPLAGRIIALKAALGDRVQQGQVLALIASGDLAQAYADDEKARDAAALAQKALVRARGVREAGGAADKDLEAIESASTQAKTELARTAARLFALTGASTEPQHLLVLSAPSAGVVTAIAVSSGAQISDPTMTLMTISNLDQVYVTASVDEGHIGLLTIGSKADISMSAYPGHPFSGAVTVVSQIVEPDTRRQKVRIALANADGRLMPNMYARVRFALPSTGGVHVPQSALLMNNDAVTVMVEVQPWVFKRRVVTIGDETDRVVQVLSGLASGDRIVVKGGVLLND